MIDHITVRVIDIEKTKAFYSKALEPLGYKLAFAETFGDTRVIGFSRNKIQKRKSRKNPGHPSSSLRCPS